MFVAVVVVSFVVVFIPRSLSSLCVFSFVTFFSKQILVTVPSALVRRCKSHFHNTELGVSFVFGVNGVAWIYPSALDVVAGHTGDDGAAAAPLTTPRISAEVRTRMARVRNCFVVLAAHGVAVYPATIMAAYTASVDTGVAVTEMLTPGVAEALAAKARLVAQV